MHFPSQSTLHIQTSDKKLTLTVELAQTLTERHRGLSHRTYLDEDKGMLFVFDEEKTLTFWMKDTLIPLDILFIDKNWKIVDIQTMDRCLQEPCPIYRSKEPAQYALEIGAGLVERYAVRVGDLVTKS